MEQERNEFSSIMDNTEENKREIIRGIEYRLDLIKSVIKSCESIVSKMLEIAIKNDFFYEPALDRFNELISWQESLLNYKKILSELSFTPDELFGEKGTIIEDAEDMLEAIDGNLTQKQSDFIKLNMDLFEQGQTCKHKTELHLKELEMKGEGLALLKQNNENRKQDLQLQVDNLKFKFWKLRERKKYIAEAEAYENGNNHTVELMNQNRQEIEQIKRELKELRYNHGGMEFQGRIKVNFVNKTNDSNRETRNINTDEEPTL